MATTRSYRPDGLSPKTTCASGDWLSVRALGFQATLATLAEYLDAVADAIEQRRKVTLLNHNLHSLYLYFRDKPVRDAYRYEPVIIDGMPVVWLLKLAGQPAYRDHRVTWIDFFWPLMERAAAGDWRVFYVGHANPTLEAGLTEVRRRFPALRIAGHHGFFDASADSRASREVIRKMNAFGTDLCLVGMGMPRQELWVAAERQQIDASAVLTCGACLEYVAGVAGTPPRWMGRWGIEWTYRLAGNPRRYAGRYLVEPWLLAGLMLRQRLWHD